MQYQSLQEAYNLLVLALTPENDKVSNFLERKVACVYPPIVNGIMQNLNVLPVEGKYQGARGLKVVKTPSRCNGVVWSRFTAPKSK